MSPRKRRFPWFVFVITAALLWAVLALSQGLAGYDGVPMHLVVDGEDLTADIGRLQMDTGGRWLLSAVLVAVGVWLLVALPLALLLGLGLVLGLVLLALVGTLGLPLLAVGLVLGLLALPLLMIVWLLKWLLG